MGRWTRGRLAACALSLACAGALACQQGGAGAAASGADGGVQTPGVRPPRVEVGSPPSDAGTDAGTPVPECLESPPESTTGLPPEEEEARRAYACAAVALEGQLVAPDGTPVADATLEVHGVFTRSGLDGHFRYDVLPRRNALLTVEALGFRTALVPVHLRRAREETVVLLPPVVLSPETPDVARLLFAGDVMLGRRFLDVTGATPPGRMPADTPGALLQASNPGPGSEAAVDWMRPLFFDMDLAAVNLEGPVTDTPATPHPRKDSLYFSLPGSLPALRGLGVGYASLGNNHVHDYLDRGLTDTLRHLEAAGMLASGAGLDAKEAYRPSTLALRGATYSFVSVSSIAEGNRESLNLLASEDSGGAADARDHARLRDTVRDARSAGHVPVVLLHSGLEFAEQPTLPTQEHALTAARAGAALVIGHHPHVPQGFAWVEQTLVAYSLGDFLSDLDRPDTRVGLLADVELRGDVLVRAAALPVLLEDFVPRPLAGAMADRELRRVAGLSQAGRVTLVPHGGRGEVVLRGQQAPTEERTVEVSVSVPPRGWAVVDLRALLTPGESLAHAQLSSDEGQLVAGRDVLRHGDFEDYDVDGEDGEAAQWDFQGTPGFICQRAPRSGAAALCLWGLAGADAGAHAITRERLRAPPGPDGAPNPALTLVGWARGRGAGALRLEALFATADGTQALDRQLLAEHPGGDFDWTGLEADLVLPRPSATVRLRLAQTVPLGFDGVLAVDDLALVAWEEAAPRRPLDLRTPHARDFLRVEAEPGAHTLSLVLRRHGLPGPGAAPSP